MVVLVVSWLRTLGVAVIPEVPDVPLVLMLFDDIPEHPDISGSTPRRPTSTDAVVRRYIIKRLLEFRKYVLYAIARGGDGQALAGGMKFGTIAYPYSPSRIAFYGKVDKLGESRAEGLRG